MIRSENGRTWSERTEEEALSLIEEEVSQLTPEEREALLIIIQEMNDPNKKSINEASDTTQIRIYDAMINAEYKRPRVDIETFVKDPYYLGETCGSTYPKYIEHLKEITTGGYKELLLVGSIGSGKTYLGSILICWVLYELSCLRNIYKTVGLSPGSPITIAGMSVNEQLAIRVVYENIASKIATSPYFKEHFPFKETKKELRFPDNIEVVALSSTDTAALGRNVIALLLDEGNFYEPIQRGKAAVQKWGDKDKARVLYDQMTRRMKSRFMRNGKMPGIAVIASSKRTRDDFTAKRISEAAKDPSVYVVDHNLWGVDSGRYGPERFHVLVGNDTLPSRILDQSEVGAVEAQIKALGDDSLVLLEVPEEFRNDFVNDLDKSIQDIGGVATVSISPFIQQRDRLEACVSKDRQHPFEVIEWDQTKPGTWVWDRFASEVMVRDGAQTVKMWQPVFHPEAPRHMHIDLSLVTDYTGIACGCVYGYTQVDRRNHETGEVFTENAPLIWVDFMLRIKPPIGGEINRSMVRGLVYDLRSHGFHISLVSADQVGSETLQTFRQQGINTERVSVDKPLDAYNTLKSAIYEKRLNMYQYEPALNELRKLQLDKIKGKVDHMRGERKDVADCLAGIVSTLSSKQFYAPMVILKGISQHSDPELESERQSLESGGTFMPIILW